MSITKLFDISRRSLAEYQKALSVTSHNIANANNPNYSRQRVILGTEKPDVAANFIWGSGMKIDDVQRVRDEITNTQIRSYNQKQTNAEKRSTILSHIESVFGEPSELGLSNLLNKCFNSWDELAVDPASTALRNQVISSSQEVTQKIRNLYEGLNLMKSDIKAEAAENVNLLNSYLKQIQSLNKQIYEQEAIGNHSNDLLDQRDSLIDGLSKLANINVSIDKYQVANISIGGVFAADNPFYTEFKVVEDGTKISIKTEDEAGTLTLNGGMLYALTDSYTNKIPSYLEQIDTFANQLMTRVNEIHSTGYTLEDTTGINFFTSYTQGVFVINEDILENNGNIAISADGSDGNGDLAVQIANLRNEKQATSYTFSESYSNLVTEIANEKSGNDQSSESFQLILMQLEQQKAATSGVSIDEEMVNVLKFQRSYDAAAKLVKTADEMLETILNMV